MKITKRFSAIAVAAIMLASLASCSGCSSSSQNSAPSGASSSGTSVVETTDSTKPPETDVVDKLLSEMTLEEKVGQMFYSSVPVGEGKDWITKYRIGGYVFSGNDFDDKSADDVRAMIHDYQMKSKVPLLIGVDEEGGTVLRVSYHEQLCSSCFDSPKNVYQNGGWEAIDATETEKAELLTSLGINVNNAPVCDITSTPDSFIYDRSFSGDPEEVSTFVKKVVAICKQKKLGTVLKHFPGYGDNTDTHEDMSYDSKPLDDFRNSDFIPFEAGIEAGADSIMVAHNIMADVDSDYPASLSKKVHDIIRNELNFDGVIMTDDLAMQAITKYTGTEAAAVTAAKCGNDILCCTDVEAQYPAVLEAVKNGEIPQEQIDASVKRILKWKQNLGLIK